MRQAGWGKKRGFTLVEVLVAVTIVAIGIVGLVSGFLSGLLLVESSRNMATAGADARAVLEEMRRLSGTGLGAVTAQNWATWSRNAGLASLQNQSVSVAYRNPNADPLEATVTVRWTEGTRNRSASFTGLVTKR